MVPNHTVLIQRSLLLIDVSKNGIAGVCYCCSVGRLCTESVHRSNNFCYCNLLPLSCLVMAKQIFRYIQISLMVTVDVIVCNTRNRDQN